MIRKYIFIGRSTDTDVHGQAHRYFHFTKDREYEIGNVRKLQKPETYRADEYNWVISDTGEHVSVSNNALRKYFIRSSNANGITFK